MRAKQYADRIIVIDDGSSDHTAEVAKMAGAEVICHSTNMGKGAALKTGFESLNGADIIVTMDSDGQHNPTDIPKLIEPIVRGEADMVNGSRYINGDKKDTPLYRRFGQIVLDKATNIDSGLDITDSQSGFRAFAAYVKDAFRFKQSGLAIESEMLADAARAGLRIKEVEIGVRYDVDCSTEHPIKHGLRVLVKVLHDMELRRPLYYFTIPGILFTALGVGLGLELLRIFFHGGTLYFGPTLLMVLLTLLGCFAALTGIILHSISKLIHEERIAFKELGMTKYENSHNFRNTARDN